MKIKTIAFLFISLISTVSCAHTFEPTPAMTQKWSNTESNYLQLEDGTQIRYLKLGEGRPLVMLHSLRTQLDLFYKLAPLLKDDFSLYLIDLPGHGYSTIDKSTSYNATLFTSKVAEILEKLDLGEVQLLGESIGASIALTVATDPKLSISKVFAINPYDYGEKYGGGIRRSENGFWVTTTRFIDVNFRWVLRDVFEGGVYDDKALEPIFLNELHKVGFKDHYGKMFGSLLKNWSSWIENRKNYVSAKDNVQEVYLIYGDHDWSNKSERENNKALISPTKFYELKQAGHFISLDNPDELSKIIQENQ